MRILVSSQYYHPAYALGGSVRNSVAVAEGLAKLGHSVSVVTTSLVSLEERPPLTSRIEQINGVSVHYLGTWLHFRKSQITPPILWHARNLVADVDVLHVVGLYDTFSPLLASMATKRGIPYCVEPAGMLIAGMRSKILKRIYHQIIGRSFLHNARRVMVTSQKEWSDAIQFGLCAEQLVQRNNGVHLDEFANLPPRGQFRARWRIPETVPLLLWLGRIEPIKNLDMLVLALSSVRRLPWYLAVVGPSESPDYMQHLRKLVEEHGLQDRVHFLPPMYGMEKLSALVDSNLVVLVSVSENWGNTVQESVAAGIPVVVTETCGVAEVVKKRAGLVVPLDLDSIASGIAKLLTDKALYSEFRQQLPHLARELSWENAISQMSHMYSTWQ